MIENLKPYPEYKDSGLPWLGQVPAHWEIRRGKSVFSESNLPVRDGDEIVTCFRDGQVTLRKNRRTSGFMTALYEAGYQGVRTGQLVIHAMDAFAGAIGISDSDGKCTPEYIVLDPLSNSAHPSYFSQLLRHAARQQFILVQCPAVRERAPRFRYPNFGCMWMPLPPANEQAAIARLLTWATNRLDRAIGAKRHIITLLQEQKQAIIHRAVTRGLDPSLPLKDSGIPWLGEIPEHWEVRRLGHAVCLQTGYPFTSTGFIQAQSGTRLLRGVNVTPSQIRWDEVVRWQRHVDDGLDDYTLQVGDVVLGMDRPIIGAGVRTALIRKDDTPSLLLQRVARLRSTEILHTEFMLLLLRGRTFHEYMAPIFTGISVPHLSPQQIKNFRVALPPIEEQRNIVAELMEQTYELDSAIASNEQEIALLREYRTRLIADVVTGKLDVREMAKELPEEELQDQPDVEAVYDADDSEEDAESDLIDTAED